MSEQVSRRDALKCIITGLVCGVVAGVGGYMAAPREVARETVTTTVTETTTVTTTQTVTAGAPAAKPRTIPSEPLKIGIVSFLTGAAAAPFGIPGKNAFELYVETINAQGGIAGRKLNPIYCDEAGGVDAQVKLARKLALEDKVWAIIGYISSADCKAVAPLADELGIPIIMYDCGTHVLMEGETSPYECPKYKLAFRTKSHLCIDNVGLALYIKKYYPNIKRVAGINPDYAWGRDSWKIFKLALEKLMPDVEFVGEWWPKLFTTDYTAHITALLAAKPDIIHTALWGGDAVTFTKQALEMGLFKQAIVAYSRGEPYPQELGTAFPEGQIINCAGPHYYRYPPPDKWPLNKWFVEEYTKRYGKYPTYPCYHAAQAMTAFKTALGKAIAMVGGWPEPDEFAEAMTNLCCETPSGLLMIREDHNGVEDSTLVGVTKMVPEVEPKFPILVNTEAYPAHLVNPPVGIRTEDWIKSWKV